MSIPSFTAGNSCPRKPMIVPQSLSRDGFYAMVDELGHWRSLKSFCNAWCLWIYYPRDSSGNWARIFGDQAGRLVYRCCPWT